MARSKMTHRYSKIAQQTKMALEYGLLVHWSFWSFPSSSTCWSQVFGERPNGCFQSAAGAVPDCEAGVFLIIHLTYDQRSSGVGKQ